MLSCGFFEKHFEERGWFEKNNVNFYIKSRGLL